MYLLWLTLFAPAYLSVSKSQGRLIYVFRVWFGLGFQIFFGNNLSRNDLLFSKGFMKFGWPEPPKTMIDFFKEEERKEERGVSEEKAQLCLNFTIWFGHTNRWLCNLNTCGSCNANITVHSTLIDINLICANIVAIFSTTFVSGLQSSRTSPACRQRGQVWKSFQQWRGTDDQRSSCPESLQLLHQDTVLQTLCI